MDKNNKQKLDAELALAGQATQLSPEELLLEQLRITPGRALPPMEFLFTLFGKPCFPRGELVGVTGKAKSGKTFVASMLAAIGISSGQQAGVGGAGSLTVNGGHQHGVSGCGSHLRISSLRRAAEAPLRVLWYDTEQSAESTQDIMKNHIVPLIGDDAALTAPEGLDVFNVRSVEWKLRRKLLKLAVERSKPDLVIVDGIRDLVNDINDGCLAQEVMEELMHLATTANCCIVCVLHQNKSAEDRNLRGWIGTELMNKAFEVYTCEKLMPQRIFKLEQSLTRKYDVEQTFYFEVDADGLPRECAVPSAEGASGQRAGAAGGDGTRTEARVALPQLNREYVVNDDSDDNGWRFDVVRLFTDAMRGEEEVSSQELRSRVMGLSNICSWRVYNALLNQALEQKLIERSMHDGRTVYRWPPF